MMDFNNEEEIGRLLKSACKPAVPSPELKEGLRRRFTLEAGSAVLSTGHSLVGWTGQPRSGISLRPTHNVGKMNNRETPVPSYHISGRFQRLLYHIS